MKMSPGVDGPRRGLDSRSKEGKSSSSNYSFTNVEFELESGLSYHWSAVGCAFAFETLMAPLFSGQDSAGGIWNPDW